MLRIAHVKADESRRRVLRLEGRVVGPWVEELRRSCDWALAAAPGLTLDLAGVTFADRTGVALLRSLRGRGVALANCSAFLAAQLKG
jgi:anti-anti-sigma regulatory factor